MILLLLQDNDVLAPLAHAFLRNNQSCNRSFAHASCSAVASSCDVSPTNATKQSNCSKAMMLFLLLFLGNPVVIVS